MRKQITENNMVKLTLFYSVMSKIIDVILQQQYR